MSRYDTSTLDRHGRMLLSRMPDGSQTAHENGVRAFTLMPDLWLRFEQGAQFYAGCPHVMQAVRRMGLSVVRVDPRVEVCVHGDGGRYRAVLHRHKTISLVEGEYPECVAGAYTIDTGLKREVDYNFERVKKFAMTISRLGGVDIPCAPRPLSIEYMYSDDAYAHVHGAVMYEDYTDGFLTLMKEWARLPHVRETYVERVCHWLDNFKSQLMTDVGAIK